LGIYDGSALKSGRSANEPHRSGASVHFDFDERRGVGTFLGASAQSEAATLAALLFAPSEFLRSCLEHRPKPCVFQVLEANLTRIRVQPVRDFIHMTLARKVIGGCREPSIRALSER